MLLCHQLDLCSNLKNRNLFEQTSFGKAIRVFLPLGPTSCFCSLVRMENTEFEPAEVCCDLNQFCLRETCAHSLDHLNWDVGS